MKRFAALLTALAFVLGLLVLPALHRLVGCDGGRDHSASACAVCQIAKLPIEDAAGQEAWEFQPPGFAVLTTPEAAAVCPAPACGPKQPRAPPPAA